MQSTTKPYAESCDQNRAPILAVIAPLYAGRRRLLEIGSGTGQHGVHFAAALPELCWQCSDRADELPGMRQWIGEAALPNLPEPIPLDVLRDPWPTPGFDAAFSANTAHIMPVAAVAAMFSGLGEVLAPGGLFALYGPFHEDGRPTSESNAAFDAWLRARDPAMGVRDRTWLLGLAEDNGFEALAEHAMPTNNRILVWRRR